MKLRIMLLLSIAAVTMALFAGGSAARADALCAKVTLPVSLPAVCAPIP